MESRGHFASRFCDLFVVNRHPWPESGSVIILHLPITRHRNVVEDWLDPAPEQALGSSGWYFELVDFLT
jgi:hypothetical protein